MKKTKPEHNMDSTTKTKTSTSRTALLITAAIFFGALGIAMVTNIALKDTSKKTRSSTIASTPTANANVSTFIPPSVTSAAWTNTNPGGGGAFTSIASGPTGTIIATTDLSGAVRSLDRGQTWDVIGSLRGLETTHTSSVAFDPVNSNKIYLGTEGGLYMSTDSGGTFGRQATGDLNSGYIGSIVVAPSNPNVVYVARHSFWQGLDSKVYKSTDAGSTWALISSNLPISRFRILKVAVGPSDNLVYAISGGDTLVNELPADQLPHQTFYKSSDGGVTWSQKAMTLGDTIVDFAVDPVNPSVLYLTTDPNGSIYKSTDGGDTWTPKTTHTGFLFVKRDQPNVIRSVNVVGWPGNSTVGVWRSNDGGDTWSAESPASTWEAGWQGSVQQTDAYLRGVQWSHGVNVYGYAKSLGLDTSDPDVMLLADSQFVHGFGGTDFGTSFKNLYTKQVGTGPVTWRGRNIDDVAVIELAVTEADPQRIYAGSYDLGFWRSLDGGISWQTGNDPSLDAATNLCGDWKGHGCNTTTIVADPTRANVVWASMAHQSNSDFTVARSTDGGAGTSTSWSAASGLMKEGTAPRFVNGLSLDRMSTINNRTLFVTSTGDVYRSQNDGMTWTKVFECNLCRTTAIDPNTGQVVYAGGEGGFFRSVDGGNTWSANLAPLLAGAMSGTPDTFQWTGVHKIVPDRFTLNKVYAVVYGAAKGLYVSENQGTTWTLLRGCTYCRSMVVDRFDPRRLYLTSSYATRNGGYRPAAEGVMSSADGGITWTPFNEGLAWTFAWPIVVRQTSNASPNANPDLNYRLYMGSPGTGYFVRDITRASSGGGGGPPDPIETQ